MASGIKLLVHRSSFRRNLCTTNGSASDFERLMLPHLDAAYSLARWLAKNDGLAEDAVQEAYLRAWRFFGSLRGDDARPWLLRIVRNACYELRQREHLPGPAEDFDEQRHDAEMLAAGAVITLPVNPEAAVIARAESDLVRQCLGALPRELSRSVGFEGNRRLLVQGDRRHRRDADRHRDVSPVSGAPPASRLDRRACQTKGDRNMKCTEVNRLLNPYIDGELDLQNVLAVEAHLQECPRCSAAIAGIQAMRTAISRACEPAKAPLRLREAVRAQFCWHCRAATGHLAVAGSLSGGGSRNRGVADRRLARAGATLEFTIQRGDRAGHSHRLSPRRRQSRQGELAYAEKPSRRRTKSACHCRRP